MMNILIGTQSVLDPILVEQLVQLPNASIHLSLSREDTLRIIAEARPAILITDRAFTPASLLQKLMDCNKDLEVYLYDKKGTKQGSYLLTRYQPAKTDCAFPIVSGEFTALATEEVGSRQIYKANNNYSK